ncbi:2-nitropropane dioxygenase [Ornithinimicrobium tianjinense]|uniref:Nucleotidyltransferase n=1 Tax=Ornithinimicrobium tianjinense TaxID=1195761 RepID=A0A917F8M2_9MICO|nr:2-nitropropane dioxygenase [Ornithinimicrobium tianjinense]GGF53592.1 hypothetical protein GCM10011366_21740 [Ornithinimicrobium tianjinense]
MTSEGGTAGVRDVDLAVRVELCHAALQHLADLHGVDLLHVKGVAFEPRWRSSTTGGSDADVLVRPSQVRRLVRALEERGWQRRSRFHTGSPFGHAQTYWHDHLGYADVHRFFPGLGRDEGTFDVLWSARDVRLLGGVPCPVPDEAGQALVFAVNEARNGRPPRAAALGGTEADVETGVLDLVPRVHAEVAWAAAHGRLDAVRDHREHDLWRAVTQDGGRVEEWVARVKAERTLTGKALTVLRAPLVNTEHLANTRGHRPSPVEVGVEFADRVRRAALEVWRSRRPGAGR